ncbi:MAG: hypothetical protein JWP35_1435 [Caulobacter sp.]|nr:hypothetical protein [Caulobacter sp.]
MKRLTGLAILVLLAAAVTGGWLTLRARAQDAGRDACAVRSFEGSAFTVCAYHQGRDRLSILLDGPHGPLGDLASVAEYLGPKAREVRFAMNGGMYAPGQAPVGLLIQDGQSGHPAELSTGSGNFFLLPNGIFYVDRDGGAHVEETHAFIAHADRAVWATQSGPLLLNQGAMHPAVMPNGESVLIRNGVCVAGPDTAWFVISDGKVSLGRLARFFRDGLGCRDALYLDGTVSSLWAPSLKRQDTRKGLGPFVVVSRGP